jgi:AcrR family transcriptional regulator
MAKDSTSEHNVFVQLRRIEESKKAKFDAAITDVQQRLQQLADDIKLLDHPKFMSNPAFEQALSQLGLTFDTMQPAVRKGAISPLAQIRPLRGTRLGLSIIEYLRKVDKPVDAESVIVALKDSGASSTIKNYLARLVTEGAIRKPERGLFAVK